MRSSRLPRRLSTACLLAIALSMAVGVPQAAAQGRDNVADASPKPSGRVQRWDAGSGVLWVNDQAYALSGEARMQFERNGRSVPLAQLAEGTIVVLHPVAPGGPIGRIEVFEPKL